MRARVGAQIRAHTSAPRLSASHSGSPMSFCLSPCRASRQKTTRCRTLIRTNEYTHRHTCTHKFTYNLLLWEPVEIRTLKMVRWTPKRGDDVRSLLESTTRYVRYFVTYFIVYKIFTLGFTCTWLSVCMWIVISCVLVFAEAFPVRTWELNPIEKLAIFFFTFFFFLSPEEIPCTPTCIWAKGHGPIVEGREREDETLDLFVSVN